MSCVRFGGNVPPILLPQDRLALDTHAKQGIDNNTDRRAAGLPDHAAVATYVRKYPNADHGRKSPTATYNCHGATFGGRRTNISSAAEIRKILVDDRYAQIKLLEVIFGDIVLYIEDGDVSHSGIVVEADPMGAHWIISKWGQLHEVRHRVSDCDYADRGTTEFWRLMR